MNGEIKRERTTRETDIKLVLRPGGGELSVETGIGFFDHMLTAFALHGRLGLTLSVKGDLTVDGHHTVEDVGIVLGDALRVALENKIGLTRFGEARVPMDEALSSVALDLSGRAYLVHKADFPQERVGAFDSCLTVEFWRALCQHAGITLHIETYGDNAHHMIESQFKAVGRALAQASRRTGDEVASTKGVI